MTYARGGLVKGVGGNVPIPPPRVGECAISSNGEVYELRWVKISTPEEEQRWRVTALIAMADIDRMYPGTNDQEEQ